MDTEYDGTKTAEDRRGGAARARAGSERGSNKPCTCVPRRKCLDLLMILCSWAIPSYCVEMTYPSTL